jgi:dephospho-CoA kinase
MARMEAAERAQAPLVVLEAIGLVEGGYAVDCDEVWLVTCDAQTQRARLRGRGVPDEDAERRIAVQLPGLARMRRAAKRTIDTSGSIEVTRRLVDQALEELMGHRAAQAPGATGGRRARR